MELGPPDNATEMLNRVTRGDAEATNQLLRWLYSELRMIARREVGGITPSPTQQATAIVHEAYMRLFNPDRNVEWVNRRHFFAAAAKIMRQLRIDDVRRRKRLKRGGDRKAIALDDDLATFDRDPNDVLAVHEALEKLGEVDPRKVELINLRYFAGLSEEETAEAMELSRRTVQSEWRIARAWLHRALSKGDTDA